MEGKKLNRIVLHDDNFLLCMCMSKAKAKTETEHSTKEQFLGI